MATTTYTYEQDADTVYRFVTDPNVIRQRSLAMGERDIQLDKVGETLTNVRTVDVQVPGFAAKVLKPTNTVREVKRWNAAERTCRMSIETKGLPARLEASIRIVPSGAGCEYIVDYWAKVSIPLIGGRFASYVEDATKKGLDDEFAWNSRELPLR